jgi:filamentous hemagglutinin
MRQSMQPNLKKVVSAAAAGLVALVAWWMQQGQKPARTAAPGSRPVASTSVSPPSRGAIQTVVKNVTIVSDGKTVYRGEMDLSATIQRIQAGIDHSHANDGTVFQNREGRLPAKAVGYYTEYVHPTQGLRGPGPQRIVVGQSGEWYYTPDHYRTFTRLN